jgi:O-antigen/teichoic acid export membrane protein
MLPKALIMISGGRIGMMTAVVGRSRAEGDYASTRQALLKISWLFGSMIAAGALVVYLFANALMTLIFPVSYAAATPYLQVLIVSYGAFAVAEMFSRALIVFDKCWGLCAIWVTAAFLAIPMYVTSGQFWGPIGVAYSIGALSVAVSVCVLWMIRVELAKLRVDDRRLARIYGTGSVGVQTR